MCDTPNSLRDENKYLERVFQKNNYNAGFTKQSIYWPSEADETNRNLKLLLQWLYLTLGAPVNHLADPTALQHSCSSQTYNYVTALADKHVKDRDQPNNRQGAVHKIKCSDCQTLVRLAETLTQYRLNSNEPREMVMLTITSLYIISWLITTLTGTLPNA